jgi:hypothetical protein
MERVCKEVLSGDKVISHVSVELVSDVSEELM